MRTIQQIPVGMSRIKKRLSNIKKTPKYYYKYVQLQQLNHASFVI